MVYWARMKCLVYVHIISTNFPRHMQVLASPVFAQGGIIRGSVPIGTRGISREASLFRDTIDPAQHELDQTIRRARRILRDHVTAETDFHKCEAALGMRGSEDASTGQRARVVLRMVRDEEFVCRLAREALGAVPGHVLDHEQGAVGDEDVIESAVGNDGFVQFLDDTR